MLEKGISLDLNKVYSYVSKSDMDSLQPFVSSAHHMLENGTGKGKDFLGWVNLPVNYDKGEFNRIKIAARRIRNTSDVFIVIGIGGSYLGARAAIEMLSNTFNNILPKDKRKAPIILYAGNNMSAAYMKDLLQAVEGMDISLNVISKSGTTTEPAVAFRLLKDLLEKKYGKEEAGHRIYVTTDKKRGALKALADIEGYETYVIPDNIGGRYSVLTAVGLLPMAVAGINIEDVMRGAADAREAYSSEDLDKNAAYRYASVRNILFKRGKTTEMMVNFEPCLHYFGEWWKQLFGESEGKENKGIFPACGDFSTDLHSMGQYIQQGLRILFETFINVEKSPKDIIIGEDKDNLDGLNFIADKSISFVNHQILRGTVLAHSDGEVPVMILNVPELTPYYFGHMVYFFEKACAMSGYLMGINPFDQPGVEAYKNNMFALLKNPECDISLKLEQKI
ncbi:glucose-6-phosphate isomerase [Clostridium kluyveri]|uniref:glucose-6-phosphate isomerase n=1 Tax=Clostridium kluyveri TaxID=1534 RepID=UPI002247EE97|nr:glucose-6-phosphate isomerase [Clostridium kluyveri]UZQ49054.1 glucose-6-phosphate isomerase [Clostridium kluyveri]